ncbi:hypothetical protein MKW92_013411, partial [Papaver armeniacum]
MDFSSDPPMKLVLSPDQLEILQNPNNILQEFDHLQDVNLSKNRYTNLVPFDQNRVVLKSFQDSKTPGSDYINASSLEVSSCESNPRIIAAQGPLQHTCEDFWEMVIQYHCPLIVMLTPLVIKCEDYFQSEDCPREFGKIHVTTRWKRTTDTLLVLRRLEVTHRESEEPLHSVIHVQYPEWPDFGVPYNTLPVRVILKMIYHIPRDLGSIIVHC